MEEAPDFSFCPRSTQDDALYADIGTTTIYARLLPQELQQIVTVFDA